MSALRFVAGAGVGAAVVALVLGAATVGPGASEPDTASAPARVEPRTAAAPGARAPPGKKTSVQPGVLARAASRRAKPAEGAPAAAGAPPHAGTPPHAGAIEAPKDPAGAAKEPVIQSVEVDWGVPPPRP